MGELKVRIISLPYIFQILYVLCFTWTRYQVSVYRTIGPLVPFLLLTTSSKKSLKIVSVYANYWTVARLGVQYYIIVSTEKVI